MANIAVIGPGAIGGTMAACLAQDPRHSITIAARTAFERLILDTPDGGITAIPRVLTKPEQATPVDWVLIATKTYDAPGAAKWLAGFRGPHTRVAILQNGVEHLERFAPYVPLPYLLPVMVDCPAERQSPGHIRLRGPALLIVPQGEAGESFKDLFAASRINVSQTADIRSELWKKLCVNSAAAPGTVLLLPAVIAQRAGIADIMRGMVRECIAVGRAEGAVMDDDLADQVIARAHAAPPDSINSMQADRLAGRPMEIDARNGVIVRLGRKHGISTPLNATMVALLEAAQK
jgi:2-dehydropantoate 2-reductase